MTTLDRDAAATSRALRNQEEVEARIRAICFKTGPPTHLGAELEWTVHPAADPRAPSHPSSLRQALGPHAPRTLDPHSPELPLPAHGTVTCEPGGQVEISSAPAPSLAALHAAVSTDVAHLRRLLADAGLTLGDHGIDPHRPPRRLLHTPRYDAMEAALGPDGRVMMCSTAGLQVCLDAGTPGEVAARWAAVNALGPPLLAAFATAHTHAGRATGHASARMAAWWAMDRRLTHPVPVSAGDPAGAWARYALDAPVTCIRREDGSWSAPPGLTLRAWAGGAFSRPPTVADVDYHLSTLFPPVRPRGYLEVRYLDAQAGDDWFAPVAAVAALLSDPAVTDQALELTEATAQEWETAFRQGVADPALRRTAAAVLDLACRHLDRTGLPAALRTDLFAGVHRRLHEEESR
ncbi:ergothioneine biosynthesis glutamate--cysteine ligase EgtA [Symbioplanes lichenis]|uniref:ergothioneine biosynthesis glutamate--cysteine ligase EgtA n=1 Tax=Symbioplanes lichenis TaxID=1629072 RepID=UPI00273919AB|nr:ergothioneine biosynthesis glutamate--cysteine ligase EgtA [Actinoplanes lichenis]